MIGIDCLCEVDQRHSLVPIEDIVPREVAVNTSVFQSKLDVIHDAAKERLRILNFKYNIAETGSWFAYIPDIFHQDGIADLRKRARHIGAMRKEQPLSQVLVLDPGCYLGGCYRAPPDPVHRAELGYSDRWHHCAGFETYVVDISLQPGIPHL